MISPHTLPVRVYWEDTDASGLVYHASYIRFMERGRTELLRSIGLDQRLLMEGSAGAAIFFVVRAMEVEFFRPAVMDDQLVVESRVTEIGGASIDIEQKVLRGTVVLTTAKVKAVCVESGRAKRLPPELRAKFDDALAC
jgi:acyl-CoA thioester hydrolase